MSKPTCSIAGCGRPRRGRGMCKTHYARWRTTGDARAHEPINPQIPDPHAAYAARTQDQGDCLVWTGGKVRGYGTLTIDGVTEYVHRWVYEQEHGPIPDGMVVDHICQVAACVKANHLRMVTRSQNNSYRSGPMPGVRSGVRNVHWSSQKNKWFVQVKGRYFGSFSTVEEASVVAERTRNEVFGKFAGKG